jgi:hypothetical protein
MLRDHQSRDAACNGDMPAGAPACEKAASCAAWLRQIALEVVEAALARAAAEEAAQWNEILGDDPRKLSKESAS